MIIHKYDDYFLIKVFKDKLESFNFFDIDYIKDLFKSIFYKLKNKYDLYGLLDVEVYINENYGFIIELMPVESYFDNIDVKMKIHLNNLFLIEIDNNSILDYEDVYYYNGKFYGIYTGICDNNVIYKGTDDIIINGIKIC